MTKEQEKALRASINPTIDLIGKETFYKALKDAQDNQVRIWSRRVPVDWTNRIIDWYTTLPELINEISDGGDILTSPEVAVILECTLAFHMYIPKENEEVYTQHKLGSIKYRNKKTWTLYCDPYFKRNKLLINPGLLNEQEIIVDHLDG